MLIRGGTLLPLTETPRYFAGDLRLAGNRIAEVGERLSPRPGEAVLDARDCFVLPGFVQTHVHVVQSLARHRADGLDLLNWLAQRIWPYEAALDFEDVAAAAQLGIAELLAGGTTSVLDMGTTHSQDAIFQAAERLGIRFTSGKCHMDDGAGVPEKLREDTGSSLATAEDLGQRWHSAAGGRLRYAVAPRFVLSCTPALIEGAVALARRHGWLLHTHASENHRETQLVRQRTGAGNVSYLSTLGVGGHDTVVAHCIHLDEDEYALLAAEGTAVAHCPGANLKLASGIADLPRLLGAGIRVGLGADGPPCNNRLSIFHEMALAGTLHNLRHGVTAIDPWTVLELATWRGAQAIGLEQVGRLAPGWLADIVVLSRDAWAMEPGGNPAAAIVFGGGPEAVRHVIVDGQIVVCDRRLLTADTTEIRRTARASAQRVASRLGWT